MTISEKEFNDTYMWTVFPYPADLIHQLKATLLFGKHLRGPLHHRRLAMSDCSHSLNLGSSMSQFSVPSQCSLNFVNRKDDVCSGSSQFNTFWKYFSGGLLDCCHVQGCVGQSIPSFMSFRLRWVSTVKALDLVQQIGSHDLHLRGHTVNRVLNQHGTHR